MNQSENVKDSKVIGKAAEGPRSQYLSFKCRENIYAIPLASVREIIELAHYTKVPLMPAFVFGIINLRGNVVPVIDLARLVTVTGGERSGRACIMVTEITHESQNYYVGLLIDEVRSVMDIQDADIEPAPGFGAGVPAEYLKGMVKTKTRFMTLLDLEQILNLEKISMAVSGQSGMLSAGQGGV